jgi:hypothetical protein
MQLTPTVDNKLHSYASRWKQIRASLLGRRTLVSPLIHNTQPVDINNCITTSLLGSPIGRTHHYKSTLGSPVTVEAPLLTH